MIKYLVKEDFHQLILSDQLTLVDFYADWCEPCKWLDKILEEIEKEADFPLNILKINTDHHVELTHEFHLRSVPVLMIFKNGELMWRMNGFMTTSELIKKLKEVLAGDYRS